MQVVSLDCDSDFGITAVDIIIIITTIIIIIIIIIRIIMTALLLSPIYSKCVQSSLSALQQTFGNKYMPLK
jgi:hypothetical protein